MAGGALAAVWLAGCAVGPNYSGPPKPETPDPTAYKKRGNKGALETRRARRQGPARPVVGGVSRPRT